MAKLSTSTVFGDLLVDGTIYGNVTGNLTGNASTATSATTATSAGKWSTVRTLTIGNTGKSVDGSANVSWTLTEIGAAASDHKHGLLHDNLTVNVTNTTEDSGWSMINSSYNGFLLKSIRTNANAPTWLCNNYSAGVAFGGADTKGVLSCAYNTPQVKIAGGNGTKPAWWIGLTGTNGTSYNLANFENKNHGTHVTYSNTTPKVAGTASIGSESAVARGDHVHTAQTSVSGNAGTATTLQTARNITIGNKTNSFNGSANIAYSLSDIGAAASSHTHNQIDSRGNVTCETGANVRPAANGLSMAQVYDNGYPTTYGNVLSMKGAGDGQLLIGWSGTSGAHAPVYVRSRRDTGDADWSGWAQVYTSANKPTAADLGLGNTVIAVNSNLTNVSIGGFDSMMTTVNSNLSKL